MYVALFVASIVFVIMFHEFGHYATAKMFGMKAERFFLGFGPTIWSTTRGETEYGVKAIPAGGFVKIAGMNRFDPVDPADEDRAFYKQAAWKRVIVLSAGSATHFVVAFVLLFVGLALVGVPTDQPSNEVAAVEPGSPAEDAGLVPGDRITAIDGTATPGFDEVRSLVAPFPETSLEVTVDTDGGSRTVTLTTAAIEDEDGQTLGFLGMRPAPVIERLGVGAALAETLTGDFSGVRLTTETLRGLGQAFTPATLGNFFAQVGSDEPRDLADGGPASLVGAGQVANQIGASGDLFGFLVVIASLNVVLAVLNMLPLPPLDGGHIATLAVEEGVNGVRRLRGERSRWYLNPAIVTPIALAVIGFFVVLSFTAIYVDITNPLSDALQ